jgi:hypothetical protein
VVIALALAGQRSAMDERSLRDELAAIERKLGELSDSQQRSLEQLFEQQENRHSEDDSSNLAPKTSPVPGRRQRRGSFMALPGVICSASFDPGELRSAAETIEAETDAQRRQYEQASLALELLLEQKRALGFDEDDSGGSSSGDGSEIGDDTLGGLVPTRCPIDEQKEPSADAEPVPLDRDGSDDEEDFTPSLLGSRVSRRTESRSTTGSAPRSDSSASVLTPRAPTEAVPGCHDYPPPPMPADSWCPAASVQAPSGESDPDEDESSYSVVEWTPSQLGSATADELLTVNPPLSQQSRRSRTMEVPSASAPVAASLMFESLTASALGGLGLVPHESAMPTEQKAVRAQPVSTRATFMTSVHSEPIVNPLDRVLRELRFRCSGSHEHMAALDSFSSADCVLYPL